MKKPRKKSNPSSAKVIQFPGTHHAEHWLDSFQAASPRDRYQMLCNALEAPCLLLEPRDLGHAMASVSQILSRHNHFDAQLELAEQLRQRAPEVYQQILPVQNLLRLQDALFRERPDEITALLTSWCENLDLTPPDVLLMAWRYLIAHGQSEAALSLAQGLMGLTADEDLEALARSLQIDTCIESVLQQQIAAVPVDWKAFERRLKELGLNPAERKGCRQRLSASETEQLIAILDACEHRDPQLYAWALPAFGRWMLEQHGLSLLLSRELLAQAIALWDWSNHKRELNEHIRFSRAQLQDYLDQPPHLTGLDQFDVVLLLWGLPYVYDWLVSVDFCTPPQAQAIQGHLAVGRAVVFKTIGPSLWSYAFVHRWPAPANTDATARAEEARHLRATREQTRPLGTRPEDSRNFDDPELPEAVFEQLLNLLASQDVRGIQQLEPLLEYLSPTQMLRVQELILSLESAPKTKPAKSKASPKSTSAPKSESGPKTKSRSRSAGTATPGQCRICGVSMAKNQIGRHLETCLAAEAAASKKKSAKAAPVAAFLLEIKCGPFWVYVLARPEATLADLDFFLRALWLECCGHMSAFAIGGREYVSSCYEPGQRGMKTRLDKVLGSNPGFAFGYEYDFGSTTALEGRVVGERVTSQKQIIRLLARNNDLDLACSDCNKPAVMVCTECIWEGGGLLCAACIEDHDCGEEMLLPVVNSPRCGVCGYTG
ncbi:MAG: hypothetical protein ACAI44_01815 [Candidatus Sericytochromatia bacterium]